MQLEGYIDELRGCSEELMQENRKLRQVHRKMGEQVCTLMETSLLRKKSAWEEQIKKLRAQVERAALHTPPFAHASMHTSVHTSIARAGRGAAASVPGDEGVADALGHAALQGAGAPVQDASRTQRASYTRAAPQLIPRSSSVYSGTS